MRSHLLLLVFVCASAGARPLSPSEEALLGAHFFADTRGMHSLPGFLEILRRLTSLEVWNPAESHQINNGAALSAVAGLQQNSGSVVGLFAEPVMKGYPNIAVAGCAVCHVGSAAGILVPGLGNKSIDLRAAGEMGFRIENNALLRWASESMVDKSSFPIGVFQSATRMSEILADPQNTSPVPGLIDNTIVYRTFFEAFGAPVRNRGTKYLNKVPHLWGIAQKRNLGLFWDGSGDPRSHGWTVAVEVMFGQTSGTIKKESYLKKIADVEKALEGLQPPGYPFAIIPERAALGKNVFEQNCLSCHGSYSRDSGGLPIYKMPRRISLARVGTDARRATFFRDPSFWEAAEKSDYRDLFQHQPGFLETPLSYVAPRLEGIWARFPYLHNASIPTLWDLLNPEERPAVFDIADPGSRERFDPARVGLTRVTSPRIPYDTSQLGMKNIGHTFGQELSSSEKWALIEYLKTL